MNTRLAQKLVAMSGADRAMRLAAITDMSKWDEELDKTHTAELKEIIKEYGWPTRKLVGEDASDAAWLLVQHADHDIAFQEECLALMKQLPEDEVLKRNIAYLEDRVCVATGRPQLYGTQFDQQGEVFGPKAVEDPDNLNNRRKNMGLSSFEKYRKRMYAVYRS